MATRTLRRDAEPENVKISFLTDKAKRDALDSVAASMDRDRSYVLNEAVEEAEAGDFAFEPEVEQAFAKYKRDAR